MCRLRRRSYQEGAFRRAHGPLFFARPKKRGEKKGRPGEGGPDENAAGDSGIFIAFPRCARPRGRAYGASLRRTPGLRHPWLVRLRRLFAAGAVRSAPSTGSKNQLVTDECFTTVARAEHRSEQAKPKGAAFRRRN